MAGPRQTLRRDVSGVTMETPRKYVGSWHGEVFDVQRKNAYRGEIILTTDGIETTYHMAHGKQSGRLTLLHESDGFLMLREDVNSWSGTLLLYLDADKKLKCVWRRRSKFGSEATMTREDSAAQDTDLSLGSSNACVE
jgi:hypothetical protein